MCTNKCEGWKKACFQKNCVRYFKFCLFNAHTRTLTYTLNRSNKKKKLQNLIHHFSK